ncbi:MAG TPA: ATP-binding protein [Longimicrobiales bacterium]|nr:ATP-binding protein [Longimicrobiales bacterium]
MYRRYVETRIREALNDTPTVLIIGPRRCGKTTTARGLADPSRVYLTLDDQTTLDVARADPVGFIRGLDRVVIDEVQRVPEIFLAMKRSVDEDPRPGRFLLTGSANAMTLPRVADSLAGRMETVRMLPLARGEVESVQPTFLEDLFAAAPRTPARLLLGPDLADAVLTGGYPEALARPTEARRQAWARAYLDAVLTRDLREIADIEKLTDFPRFVRLLAHHAGHLVNYTQIGASVGVTHKTGQRYVRLLEQIFLVRTLEPWHTSALKRIVKTPKLHFLDTGLLAAAQGLGSAAVGTHRAQFGPLLEGFVHAELLKLAGASPRAYAAYHFRDQQQNEVDVVLERDDGMVAGIKVKASATVGPTDFRGLRSLAEATRDRFAFGGLLYDGEAVVPVGPRLAAIPLSCLWG